MVTFDNFESIYLEKLENDIKYSCRNTESLLIRKINYHKHKSIEYTF